MSYRRGVRTLLLLIIAVGCKGTEHKAAAPHVSSLPPLAAGATATIDPQGMPAEFPKEAPAIVLWQGGGDPPRTIVGVRMWADGTIRFRCSRRGTLPRERVVAMLDTFERAGWLPAAGAAPSPLTEPDPGCITTSVQVTRDGRSVRRNSSCGESSDAISDAAAFIQAVVGPDPC